MVYVDKKHIWYKRCYNDREMISATVDDAVLIIIMMLSVVFNLFVLV